MLNLKEISLVSSTIAIVACGGSTSVLQNEKACRNFASDSISDEGVTQTCSFDRAGFLLICSSDAGGYPTTEYKSLEDFVLESRTLGIVKATNRTDNGVQINYQYDAGKLIDVTMDFSSLLGEGSYLTVNHHEFDSLNRPVSGTTSSNLGSSCSGIAVDIEYFQRENRVRSNLSGTGYCSYISNTDSVFDINGNLIEITFDGTTTIKYTVLATNEVCI